MVGHYKRSKFIAENEVHSFIAKGVPAVIVYPSTPIGPRRKPTPTGQTIVDFLNGRIPAFLDTGLNFVDVGDVAAGHWLASERGVTGQSYILGNRNMTLREFFESLARITGSRPPKVRLPISAGTVCSLRRRNHLNAADPQASENSALRGENGKKIYVLRCLQGCQGTAHASNSC